jgi:hypothetical protein
MVGLLSLSLLTRKVADRFHEEHKESDHGGAH